MKRLLTIPALLGSLLMATAALAAERTVTLAVENMTCASCPYIVKKTMERVSGVSKADVSFEKKIAVVTFDDAKTALDAVINASNNAGFPAKPVGPGG